MSLNRTASAVIGATLTLAAAAYAPTASAADLPVKALPKATPWVLDVHGYADFTVASTRVTGGGLYLYNTGYVKQGEVGLSLDIYKNSTGFINSFSVFGGVWNEFWSSPPAGSRQWQEMDWWLGFTVGFAKYWSFTAQTVQFNFPGAAPPPTAYNYDFKLAFNDAFLGGPIVWNPYVDVFYNAAGGSTVVNGVRSGGYRVSLGVVPTISLAKTTSIPLTISAPTWVTVGPSNFWNRNDGTTNLCGTAGTAPCALSSLGYYSTGVKGVLSLDSWIPKRLGSWYVKGGVQYYHINNDALLAAQVAVGSAPTFATAKRDIAVTYAGFGFSF